MEKLRSQLSIPWHIGHDSSTPRALGGDLPWRAAAVAVWSLLSKVERKEKAGRRRDMGVGTFLQQSFRRFDLNLQKVFAGGWPKMWLVIGTFIRVRQQAIGGGV